MSENPDPALTGKVALVTGAATGIGKAIAHALAAAGARVAINHPHTPEVAAAAVAEITSSGGTVIDLAADVRDRDEYAAMVDRLIDSYGRWDILVNNAAVAIRACSTACSWPGTSWPTVGESSPSPARPPP
ncbi:NAD(P)-dependent dehydrogenase (short-subunit alcohol dehydrogenase family) [Nocardia sp. GAS34]